MLDVQQIMKILQHRYPFLLVDRIVELEPGKRAVGLKNVTINEQFFTGHFPGNPIMPAVLIVEAMAQVGGVLLLSTSGFEGKLALFGGMDKLRFRRLVRPGDQLIMEVEIIKWRRDAGRVRVVGKVDGQVAAHGEYLFVFMKEGDSAETSMAEEEG